MEKLSKTQVSVLVSYSSPFVLISALVINTLLVHYEVTSGPLRLILLSASFPIGLSFGRLIYIKRSHVVINFDNNSFSVVKGSKEIASGTWRHYRVVSLILDQFGKPNLRLYESMGGEYVELPISKTNAVPQKFRDYVQGIVRFD